MKKILLILALAMALSALASSAILAAGGKIRFGNLAIVPSFGVDEYFEDNIYLEKKGKESDWISHLRPGLMLDYTIEGRGKFKFGYAGDYASYKSNSDNDWKRHLLFLDLDYLSPGGLIVKIKNNLENVEFPYGSKEEYKSNPEQRAEWQEDLNTEIGYKFSDRFKLLTYYNYHRQDFKNNGGGTFNNNSIYYGTSLNNPSSYYGTGDFNQDYYYNEAGLGFETKVTHKTWAFLRYYNGSQRYFTLRDGVTGSNNANYDWQRVNTGLGWDDGGRFGGEFNVGYQWNSHQNNYDLNGYRYKDRDTWTAATHVIFRQAEGRKFLFTANRTQYQLDSGVNGYYVTTAFGIGVEQKIKSKFFLTLAYIYEKNKFSSTGSSAYYSFSNRRTDNYNQVRTGLKYTITEWLTAGVEYNFMHNHSSDSSSGFLDNQVRFFLDFKPADYH